MQNSQVQVIFGSKISYLKLTDNPLEFMNIICREFEIKQFTAELLINNTKKQKLEFRNPLTIKREELLTITQLECKIIQISEIKNQSNLENNYQFFKAFINGKTIQCCTARGCQLCQGCGQAEIQENDYSFINQVIRNKLEEKLKIISEIIFKRDKTKIFSPEDFLQYHLNIQNSNNFKEFMTITSENAFIHYDQDVILQDDKFKVKILKQSVFQGKQGGEAVMLLKYMNDGGLNWPQKIQLVCNEGPFQIRQNMKSLNRQQITCQEIKIHIPNIPSNVYKFSCRFEYQNEQNQKIQFGPVIILSLIVKDTKLIDQIQKQLIIMGFNEQKIKQIMNTNFEKFINQKLTVESIINEFLGD